MPRSRPQERALSTGVLLGATAHRSQDHFAQQFASATHSHPRPPTATHSHSRPPTATYSHLWPPTATYSHPRPPMATYGQLWPLMATHGQVGHWKCLEWALQSPGDTWSSGSRSLGHRGRGEAVALLTPPEGGGRGWLRAWTLGQGCRVSSCSPAWRVSMELSDFLLPTRWEGACHVAVSCLCW